MGLPGLKPAVTLTQEDWGNLLYDPGSGVSLALSDTEAGLLKLYNGRQSPGALANLAQANGPSVTEPQARTVLERLAAHGFLAAPVSGASAPPEPLAAVEIVPAFRGDLTCVRSTAAYGLYEVQVPDAGVSFTLYDYELSAGRLLDGRRTVEEVVAALARLGVATTAAGLTRFVRSMEALGLLAPHGTESRGGTTWAPRSDWGLEVRDTFATALRLMRVGQLQEALAYVEAFQQLDPSAPEATELKDRIEQMTQGRVSPQVPFDGLYPSPPAAPAVEPPPPPVDEALEPVAAPPPPPPVVPAVPAPRASPAGPPRGLPTTTTPMMAGLQAPAPVVPPVRQTLVYAMSPVEEQPPESVSAQLSSMTPAATPYLTGTLVDPPSAEASVQVDPALAPEPPPAPAPPAPEVPSAPLAALSDVPGQPGPAPAAAAEERAGSSPGWPGVPPLVPDDVEPAGSPPPVGQATADTTSRVPRRTGSRLGLKIALGALTLAILALAVPVPRPVRANCLLKPVVAGEPQAPRDGQVSELIAADGAAVEQGAGLAMLAVEELTAREQELEQSIAAAKKALLKLDGLAKSPKARKAQTAVTRADRELQKAKAAVARLEKNLDPAKKPPAPLVKARKAADAKQRARDKAQAVLDRELRAADRATHEKVLEGADGVRAEIAAAKEASVISAPAAGRFVAPVKHAVGMGVKQDERYGTIAVRNQWWVTVQGLPPATEPNTAFIEFSGKRLPIQSGKLTGSGATRTLEGLVRMAETRAPEKPVAVMQGGRMPLALRLLDALR